MAIQKREYELSVWHEKLNSEGTKQEEKMAIIGAHDMTYLGRATAIRFITKLNGTHELTFQMPDKFFDSEFGDFVLNEFNNYVTNENKVKLFYKNQWFELYVKNVKETKHYKSFMRTYTCTDAFIDELSRNGYNIRFNAELYNNVEEIGVFSDEILEDSQWEYKPENNWGDFTEYLEERLFKIPVGQFKNIQGYKLNFNCTNDDQITNRFTNEKRGLQLGDDLARQKGWFWDCYDNATNISLIKNKIEIPNDGYIYVPYSQLNFCYKTTGEESDDNQNFIASTEEPITREWNGIESILLVPTTIDPSALIEFIAIPSDAEIEVDEAGLIVNKNYHYVMTVEDWNNSVSNKWWYTEDVNSDISKDYKKEIIYEEPDNLQFYRKPVVYNGYLTKVGDLEIENGKKISISDRTEINISEEIDQYVKVYNNKSEEYNDLYTISDDWKGNTNGYRVCSATKTRQVVPQLARNYFENAVDIQSTNGWEVMELKEVPPGSDETSASVELQWIETGDEEEIKQATLNFIHSQKATNSYSQNTILNFGAVGQEKKIKKGQVYCFGIEVAEGTIPEQPETYYEGCYLIIGKGGISTNGNYTIDGFSYDEDGKPVFDEKKVIKISLKSETKQYCLFKSNINIENPYLGLYFVNIDDSATEEVEPIKISSVWLFEAYTKGIDQFEEEEAVYKYSGRDYILKAQEEINDKGYYNRSKYVGISDIKWFSYDDICKEVLFETDIMRGDTYGYQRYFIQQLALKEEENNGYDTFTCKKYLSEEGYDNQLPLSAQKYTDDDYEITTNYIDLNQCPYYKTNAAAAECDCNYHIDSNNNFDKICMYQKYGYCPYLFKTEKHCRKVRTLNGEKSNRFNLTQELGKVFEVYPQYYIEHNSNGSIKGDINNRPIKDLFYITEKGSENKIGFRYEKNLADISRTIVSDQIVTKLYVEDNDSELSKTGMCSIKTAEDNPSKDNFIIDLSYYIKQGMLEQDQVYEDLYGINNKEKGYLKQLGYNNIEYDRLSNKIINLTNESFTELQSNVYTNLMGIEAVLKEVAKIKKQMSRYEGKFQVNQNLSSEQETQTKYNDTYENYIQKLKKQKTTLTSLIYNTLYSNNKYDGREIIPQQLIDTKGIDFFMDDYKENHTITSGMLGQYNKQYKQIQIWKKQRAAYLKKINEITSEFAKKYEAYIKEGTWTDSNYLTDNAYYHDAVQVAAEGAIPKVSYDIKVVPLGILDEDYEVGIADTTYVEDIGMFGINKRTGLPNRLKVIISELSESLDKSNEDSISVQNFTTQFEDLFQQVTASVQSLTFNENIYKRSSNFTSNQNIEADSLQGTLDTNNLTLLNTQEQNIKLDANGQSGSDINNHNNKYKLDGQGLFFSNNGGESWNIGVGPSGINADYINTGTLDAGNIRIVDNDYIYFLWDKGGITAYRTPQDEDSTFGIDFARFNKYGLSLVEGNKIRLRAGYAYQINSDGDTDDGWIYKEDEIINEQPIGFYLYDENGNAIFKTEIGDNSARLSLAGEIYADSQLDKTTGDKPGEIGLYIYNQGKFKSSASSTLSKRLLSILQVRNDTSSTKKFDNIFSVLEDGTLYIGSTAKAYTKDQQGEKQTDKLDKMGEFLEIDETNPQCIRLKEGQIFFGELNLQEEIERKINEVAALARDKVLITHNHTIPALPIATPNADKNIETYRMKINLDGTLKNEKFDNEYLFELGTISQLGIEGVKNTSLNFKNINSIWIAISDNLVGTTEHHGQSGDYNTLNGIHVDWIKLTDFIKVLQTSPATTGYAGNNQGGQGDNSDIVKPGYYFEEPLSLESTPPFEKWSTKGQTSVPKYVQWYARNGGGQEEVEYRRNKLSEHGFTNYEDWADMKIWNYGKDVAYGGCGICAYANSLSGLLREEITPDLIANTLYNNHCSTIESLYNCWVNALSREYSNITMTAISWQSEVDAALEAGDCIILNINNSFTNGGHYVCCYGKDNDGYYISDSRGFTNGYAFDTPYSYQQITAGLSSMFKLSKK